MGEDALNIDEIMSQTASEDATTRVISDERPPPSPPTGLPSTITRSHETSQYAYPNRHPIQLSMGQNPSVNKQITTRRSPSVMVYAQRDALRGAIGQQKSRLPPSNSAGLLGRILSMRSKKKVLVEGVPLGTKDSVFFAPDDCLMDGQEVQGTSTSFVNIDPRVSPYTVHRGDPFEISFQGVSVSASPNMDGTMPSPELLLYSLTKGNDPLATGSEVNCGNGGPSLASTISIEAGQTDTSVGGDNVSMQPRAMSSSGVQSIPSQNIGAALFSQRAMSLHAPSAFGSSSLIKGGMVSGMFPSGGVPTGLSSGSSDVPFIHYDPVIDGHDNGTESDVYVPVPATKSLYLRCMGKKKSVDGNGATIDVDDEEVIPQSVSIRFTIMEIDKVSDVQARSISGVDQLGNYVSNGAENVPYLELLTRAFAVASSLGKNGLKRYERPDHVHSVDMEFLLAERDEETGKTSGKGPSGNYLQYGYYFFLSDKVDAKLYAQTCSSSQSVPLLLKREGFTKRMENRNEKEYFPLNGISYLVAKVTRGCKHSDNENIPSLREEHKRRLDNMLQMSHVIDMLAAMHGNSKASLNGARSTRRY